MPLRVIRRKDRAGALTIVGTVAGRRIRKSAESADLALAKEEAATLEAQFLRNAWHGERTGVQPFATAVNSYLARKPRSAADKRRIARLLRVIGTRRLDQIDQAYLDKIAVALLGAHPSPATVNRQITTPVRAIMRHAARRGWCNPPLFEQLREPEGRTLFLNPDQAERLMMASSPSLRPLLMFLIGTGARLAEALYLDWRDVDLVGARAIFWPDRTKARKRRNVMLPPRVVAALAQLAHRDGMVFRDCQPSAPTADAHQQIRRPWDRAIERAGLGAEYTPHTLRHTWASWHYALHRDLLRLKVEGGWGSADMVERYAHLMPEGQQAAIHRFLGTSASPHTQPLSARA